MISTHDSGRRVGLLHAIAANCDDIVCGRDTVLFPFAGNTAGWVRQLVVGLGELGAAEHDERLDELLRLLGLGLAWAEAIAREQAR